MIKYIRFAVKAMRFDRRCRYYCQKNAEAGPMAGFDGTGWDIGGGTANRAGEELHAPVPQIQRLPHRARTATLRETLPRRKPCPAFGGPKV